MRRQDFEAMVRRMADELPETFTGGLVEIAVTGKTFPHPVREGVYTLGECIPHEFGAPGEEDAGLRSTVVLHYGSFAALAGTDPNFDWRQEAWETLTHEVRHHLEWRARAPELEALDAAVEANYARHDEETFPPLFYLDGERVAAGVTKVEDDVFVEAVLSRAAWKRASGAELPFVWHGATYGVSLPAALPDVLFVVVYGVTPEPPGELVVVVRRRPALGHLFRRPTVRQVRAEAKK